MTYEGEVVRNPFGAGTKSDRDAACLVTASGEYVLRRQGGNAFFDPEIDKLVGHRIACNGQVTGYTLIMSEWHVLK